MIRESKMLTVEEVSEILSVKPTTLREWLKSGYMPGYRFGREWRISETELEKFVEEHRATGEE